jgi:thiol:disulfide interchange protein
MRDLTAAKIESMGAFRFFPSFAAAVVAVLLAVPGPSRAATKASTAVPAEVSIKWRAIAAGEAEAKKSGKPALYFFTAAWCQPCHLLDGEVFAVPETAAQVERDYVPIRVEDRMRETGTNAPEMLALANRYGLQGFPTLVVSRPGLAVHVAFVGWEGKGKAFDFLKRAKTRFLDLEKRRAEVKK